MRSHSNTRYLYTGACAILAICIAISGCKKTESETQNLDADKVAPAEQGSNNATDKLAPAEQDNNAADKQAETPESDAKPDVEPPAAPKEEMAAAPLPMPAFNAESLAKARARADAKRSALPCPKGAKLTNGLCVCPAASGTDADGKKCKLKPKAYPLFSNDFKCVPNFWECQQTVMCVNPKGCHTADGLHYGNYYTRAYIVGGVDTSITSFDQWNNEASVCVLDRTDGIPLFTARPANDSDFACDQEFCPCGTDTCLLGELCKTGACGTDNSPLPTLNSENSAEIATDSLPLYLKQHESTFFDVDNCPGGKMYCHSAGMPAIPSPGEDYSCQNVASLPGIQRSGLMAWVCTNDKGCACENEKCDEGSVCINGACHKPECHGEGMPALTPPLSRDIEDYKCIEVNSLPGNKRPGLMAWVCQNTHGCSCSEEHCLSGGACCKEGEACIDGKCYKP